MVLGFRKYKVLPLVFRYSDLKQAEVEMHIYLDFVIQICFKALYKFPIVTFL